MIRKIYVYKYVSRLYKIFDYCFLHYRLYVFIILIPSMKAYLMKFFNESIFRKIYNIPETKSCNSCNTSIRVQWSKIRYLFCTTSKLFSNCNYRRNKGKSFFLSTKITLLDSKIIYVNPLKSEYNVIRNVIFLNFQIIYLSYRLLKYISIRCI